jgi:hypothetical protein
VFEHSWVGRFCIRNRPVSLLYALFAAVLILGLTFGAGASLAQDDVATPVDEIGDAGLDQPAEEPIEEPAEPPADEQIETPVGDEPAVDEPVPEEQPVDETGDIDEGTPDDQPPAQDPTETPSPTPTIVLPTLVIADAVTARCELAPEQPNAVLSGGTQQYDCRADLGLDATAVDPAQVAIDWQVDVETGGVWIAQLRADAEHPWSDLEAPPVLAAQSSLDDVVLAADDSGFQTTETERFQLLITRPMCETTPATIKVRIAASPSLDGAVVGQSALAEPLTVEPALAAIGQPVVTFEGPLNFGSISADASGPEVSTLSGTLGLQLSGMNATCGSWQISIGGAGMVGESGQPLTGGALVLLPSTASGVACDIRDGCPVAQVAADPSADATQTIALALELRLGDAVLIGTFSTSLTVTITPLDGPTTDGNGD